MKNVVEKTYLGHLIQNNGRNDKNIRDKVNKAVGSVEKFISAIIERPYGHHKYKAALLMRQGLMLGGMLTNSETWINITEADIAKLSMPDTQLQRRLLSVSGNPSKVFMCLELGLVPENNWEQVKENDTSVERQFEIAKIVKARQLKRQKIIENFEAGHPQDNPGSRAPVSC